MPKTDNKNMVLRTVYLPKPLDNHLRDLAFKLSMSKGEFIRLLVQESLERRAAAGEHAIGREPRMPVESQPTTVHVHDRAKVETVEARSTVGKRAKTRQLQAAE